MGAQKDRPVSDHRRGSLGAPIAGESRFSGTLLRRERVKRGYSQTELARLSGVATNTISYVETGQRSPHGSTLRLLAAALKVEVSYFYEEDGGDTAA